MRSVVRVHLGPPNFAQLIVFGSIVYLAYTAIAKKHNLYKIYLPIKLTDQTIEDTQVFIAFTRQGKATKLGNF